MKQTSFLKVAEIVFSISFDLYGDYLWFNDTYSDFIVDNIIPDIILQVHRENTIDLSIWELVFDTRGIWRLLQKSGQYAISIQPNSFQVGIFQSDYSVGEIFNHKNLASGLYPPIERAMFEVLLINLLAKGKGVMLHACAIKDDDVGWLFPGVSGAGKSTMSDLWSRQKNVNVLSDDRIVVSKRGDSYWMFGTPWHGKSRFAYPKGVLVDNIMILHHKDFHKITKIKQLDAVSQLLICSFPTFWNSLGMDFTLDFLSGLSQAIPCHELGFVPEPDVVDFVRCFSQASEATNRIIQ